MRAATTPGDPAATSPGHPHNGTGPQALDAYLAAADRCYNPATHLVWGTGTTPGYHTHIADPATAHPTLAAADYSLALLGSGDPARIQRAHQVLHALLELQMTDPLDEHYGLWGWFAEEPPAQMAPADWNWADFIGARLAQILARHADALQPDICTAVQDGLRHAALAIFRRNVHLGYTNIAIMGGVVTAAAGEQLQLPFLIDFARRRLAGVRDATEAAGGFSEYNSPTYTHVVIAETERAAHIITDPNIRGITEQLRAAAWRTITERFHPRTGQLAGPHSRGYDDWLPPRLARHITAATGTAIPVRGHDTRDVLAMIGELVPALPCPPDLAGRITALPQDPHQLVTRFATGPAGDTTGTTWFTDDACLGSINEDFAFGQRRLLLGYWRTPTDPAVALRARMLLNGHDLSAAWCRQSQDGPRVLSAWWLSYDSGDSHPNLDKPAGSIFTVGDLRLRISLNGNGVRATQIGQDQFAVTAGDWQATITIGPAQLNATPGRWQHGHDEHGAYLDAVLYDGPPAQLDFHDTALMLAFGLHLHPTSQPPAPQAVRHEHTADGHHWQWHGLTVTTPASPTAFAYR